MSVARNWVETGHYGHYLEGERAPASLAGHFPVVAQVAVSFRLFGIGIWQARIAGVFVTSIVLLLAYSVSRKMFGPRIAAGTLVLLLLSPIHSQIHPFLIGRQVLGEIPSLFYILLGFAFFLWNGKGRTIGRVLAAASWGIAFGVKAQVVPFLTVSFVIPLVLVTLRRQWRTAGIVALVFAGSVVTYGAIEWGKDLILAGRTLPGDGMEGLTGVLAIVMEPSIRLERLRFALVSGLPLTLALLYASVTSLGRLWRGDDENQTLVVARVMLLSLAASWYGWYLLLSIGWGRYLFPAVVLGIPFVAWLLHDLTGGFQFRATWESIVSSVSGRKLTRQSLMAFVALALVLLMCRQPLLSFLHLADLPSDNSVVSVARFINESTPEGSLIETYESELLFLLERPVHYPPPHLNVALIRRGWHDQTTPLAYDLSTIEADYIVVGDFGRGVYDPLIQSGAFQSVRNWKRYSIYRRVHDAGQSFQ